jgi:hypothetical protein
MTAPVVDQLDGVLMKWRSAMSYVPHPLSCRPGIRPRKRPGRRVGSLVLAAGLTAGLTVSGVTLLAASPASAASVCDPGTDTCVITGSVNTPLGPVTIAVSAANVVTVQLTPTAPSTLVIGIPFAFPPGPPTLPGYARTSITTAGGVVSIDTFLAPPGAANRFALPDLAIVSIHPPGPCRVQTSGTTVVFTPVIPPGPPA